MCFLGQTPGSLAIRLLTRLLYLYLPLDGTIGLETACEFPSPTTWLFGLIYSLKEKCTDFHSTMRSKCLVKKKKNPKNLSPEHTSVFLYFQKLETDAMKSRSVHNKNKTSPRGCFVLFFCIIFLCLCMLPSEEYHSYILTGVALAVVAKTSDGVSLTCLLIHASFVRQPAATPATLTDIPYTSSRPVTSAAPGTNLCIHDSTCISCAHATHHQVNIQVLN